jgi:hypothetical protein
MRKKVRLHDHLAVIAVLTFAAHMAHATTLQEITSFGLCFPDQQDTTGGVPLSASGQCGNTVGVTAAAKADIATGALGAQATSNGLGDAGAMAQFSTDVFFLPNQVVPITVTMRFTGSITGDQAFGDLFQAAVSLNGLNFGVAGADTDSGFDVIANGQSGVGPFVHAVVNATGSRARDAIDMTLTFSETLNVGPSGFTAKVGGFVEAAYSPAVTGNSGSSDFLDPASVSFSVPAGIQFTSDGFLAAPEPTTMLLDGGSIATLVLLGRSKRG